MKERIVVLAVTKMLSGMCVGGVSLDSGKWIRPVKEFSSILPGDLRYPDRTYMQPFDVVELSLSKYRPQPPHVEDWVCDFVRERPVLVRHLDEPEREDFLKCHAESDGLAQLDAGEWSLCLLEPQEAQALFAMDDYSGKYDVRLHFPMLGERAAPVTDVKWRALGKRLLESSPSVSEGVRGRSAAMPEDPSPALPETGREQRGRLRLKPHEIAERIGVKTIYPAIGLSRLHEGNYWRLIIGVHCAPDYEAEIDYGNL